MSYFLPEKGVLFLHIPRTGGTFVGHSLALTGLEVHNWGRVCEMYRPRKHTILPHYRPDLLAKIKYIFTFVRRPVPYYITVWRFTTRQNKDHPKMMNDLVYGQRSSIAINEGVYRWKPDFEEWMEEMLEEEPGWVTRYYERFVGPVGGEFPHFIGRTETLEQDMEQVMQILGYEKEWEKSKPQRDKIVHARNTIGTGKAPHVEMSGELQERVERSERVMLRRFYGEESFDRRFY